MRYLKTERLQGCRVRPEMLKELVPDCAFVLEKGVVLDNGKTFEYVDMRLMLEFDPICGNCQNFKTGASGKRYCDSHSGGFLTTKTDRCRFLVDE